MNRSTNPMISMMKIHLRDKWGWIIVPWIILLSSFMINIIIGTATNAVVYSGGLASIYIYMLVMGSISIHQTFPFAIGFNVRRKDYFLGTLITIGLVSIVFAIILAILNLIETQWMGWWTDLHFFHVAYMSDGSIGEQIWVNFSLFLNLFFLGFVIASIFRRYGRTGMYVFFTALLLILTIAGYMIGSYDIWKNIFDWFAGVTAVQISSGLFLITLIYMLLSYLLLRRSTI